MPWPRMLAEDPGPGKERGADLRDAAPPGVPRKTTEYPGEEGVFDTEIAAGSYVVEVRDGKETVLARAEAVFVEGAEGRIDLPLER